MTSPLVVVKSVVSVALLVFSLLLIHALILGEETAWSADVHPAFAFAMFWGGLIWLSMVEGGQASMVGLPPIDRSLYERTHPISHAICAYGHAGDNLDRYLMGRQFMVLAMVFIINKAGVPVPDPAVWNLPSWMTQIFLESGLAMILATCMIGQLSTQINASHCMLDYINTHFMTFTLYVALGIEASGLLHASYWIQMVVAEMAGRPIASNEPDRSGFQRVLFWARVVLSTALLVAAIAITFIALFDGKTTMWEGIPSTISMIITLVLWSVVGMLEGMQIAFFAVAKLTHEERKASPWAARTCDILFDKHGYNLPGFMVGRQLGVVACFFVAARATTMDIADGQDNVLGVPDAVQAFFDTGLLGAFITTVVASIAWQLVASAFPMAFLSTPLTYLLLRICLWLEATGVCQGAWVLAAAHRQMAGFNQDEVYVGTAEERAARAKADVEPQVQPGHMYPGVPTLPVPQNRGFSSYAQYTLEEMNQLEEQLEEHKLAVEDRLREVEAKRQQMLAEQRRRRG